MWYWLAEPFLYVSFAIACGYILLNLVPAAYRPVSYISYRVTFAASIGIGVLSFFPILRIVSFFAEDIGWGLTFKQVILQFTEGRVYMLSLVVSIMLAILSVIHGRTSNKLVLKSMMYCLAFLIVAQGWSSHVAAWYGSWGIIAQTLHILAVSLWVGPLLLSAWYARQKDNWSAFLSWYHPMAILCMLVIASSGFFLAIGITPEYVNAWKLSYGQALLIKHILLIPLALFAIINGFWVKRKLQKDNQFQPQIWARAESIILVVIFSVTGFMNQQPAPHDVSDTLNESPASPLYLWFTGGELDKASDLIISFHTESIVTLIAASVTLTAAIVCVKRRKAGMSTIWSLISALIIYYALMLAIV